MKNVLMYVLLFACFVSGFIYFNQKNPIGKKIINVEKSAPIFTPKTQERPAAQEPSIEKNTVSDEQQERSHEPEQKIEKIANSDEQVKLSQKATITTIETTEELITQFSNQKPSIIMGSMIGCHHCKVVEPIFKKHAEQNPNIDFFITNGLKTNMSQAVKKATNDQRHIKGFPAFLFIKNGQIQDHLLGAKIEELEKKIRALY